jgi:ABC-2 type transport system ATP-binding protein
MTSALATAAPSNAASATILHVEGLCLSRGGLCVLDEVSFSLKPGEILAVLGPNGAGKTTLLETVAGLRRPDRGRVRLGENVLSGLAEHARVFSFLLDEAELPGEVRVATLLDAVKRRRGIPAGLADRLIQRLGLVSLLGARASELSRGERRRVALFDTLCTGRPVLVMDEPFGVFDPLQLLDILALIRERAAAGPAMLLSLHQMSDAEKIAARCLLMRQGRVIALGTLAELRQRAGLPGGSLEDIFLALLSEQQSHAAP